jgi:hypothetical protein
MRVRAVAAGALTALSCIAAAPARADTVLAEQGSEDLVAAGGALYFSERQANGRYRLLVLRDGAVSGIGLPSAHYAFYAGAGTDAQGRQVLIYSRCPRGRCTSIHLLDVATGQERRLKVTVGRGCQLAGPSIERGTLMFVRMGSCPRRGIWLRRTGAPARRLSRAADTCCTAQLADGTVVWLGSAPGGLRVTVRAPDGARFSLFEVDDLSPRVAAVGFLIAFDGHLYWGAAAHIRAGAYPRPVSKRVFRALPEPFAACEATDRDLPPGPHTDGRYDSLRAPRFAIDAGGLYYATDEQILRADTPPPAFDFRNAFIPTSWAAIGSGCEAV